MYCDDSCYMYDCLNYWKQLRTLRAIPCDGTYRICGPAKRWYLPNMRPAKAQTSLRMRAVSPEPSLPKVRMTLSLIRCLTYRICEQQKIRQACACAQFKVRLRPSGNAFSPNIDSIYTAMLQKMCWSVSVLDGQQRRTPG